MTKRNVMWLFYQGKRPPYVPWIFNFIYEVFWKLTDHYGGANLVQREMLDGNILIIGHGGQPSNVAVNLLDSVLNTKYPIIATFMFGVNDTRWSVVAEDAKATAFVAGLTTAVNLAKKNYVVLLLFKESNFSHSNAPDEFALEVNGVSDRLVVEQDKFATARHIPVIDNQGAYIL